MLKRRQRFKNDRYLQMLFRQLPGVVWTTDSELCLTYVAGRLANNMPPRAKPGMSLYELLGGTDWGNQIVGYHLAATVGEPQSFEREFNGRSYQCFIDPLTDEDGHIAGSIGAAFDVTEQRTIQDRLARSEALLAQAQRVAHIGSFEWDLASNAVTWCGEMHRIYGMKDGEFEGTYEGFLAHVHPDDIDKTKTFILDALRTRSPFAYEHRIVRTDGATRVLQTRGEVIMDDHGQPVRMAGSCWDITELRQAMDRLERARSLLEAAIEATADGLLVVGEKGVVTVYNRQFLALWRIPPELAQHKDDDKLLAYVTDQLEDPEKFLYSTRELYREPDRESCDMQHFKDGRVFERFSRPQRIGSQIVGRVWSFRDVTERETLLRRALFLADATRLLTSLNIEPALESVAHLAVPLLGDACSIDLFANGHPRRVVYASTQDAASLSPGIGSAVMGGHSTLYSMGMRSCIAVPFVIKNNVIGAMTLIAPTSRRYTRSDLEFAETLAHRAALAVDNASLYHQTHEALRARDEFLTIVAHEIRGPITSIHMAVQSLHNGDVPASATGKLLMIIQRADRRLARFVNELLDLGRIQAGQMSFNLEEVDLGDVLRDAASSLSDDIARSRSRLSIVTEGNPVGHWDKYGLQQVAANLLANAIKFGEGKPIDVTVRERDGHTTLEIRDHGSGMKPEVVDRLFQPFERGVSVRNYGGLGLGLFIARTILEGLGGSIHVQSKPGEGATFTVELNNTRTR